MSILEICQWHKQKMMLIAHWYKKDKITFEQKLLFQMTVTIERNNKLYEMNR